MEVRDKYSEDQIVIHQVSKEDKDLILEYNLVEKRDIPKVDVYGVKIDNFLSRNELVLRILDLAEKPGVKIVYAMDPHKIMHVKGNTSLRRMVNKADIVYAAASGIRWVSRMIYRPVEEWVNQISLIVDLVRLSEVKNLPIFFLGGKPGIIESCYFNLRKSFPEMQVVGRHTGYFDPVREKAVLEAIRKTSPKILMVGLGYPLELSWINKNKKNFENMVIIGVGSSFDIISGKVKKAPDYFQNNGLTWLYRIISRPYRLIAWMRMILFFVKAVFIHIFQKPASLRRKK